MNEKMSAWMDDELNRFEERALIEDLEKNPELRARWERYHLAREAMRHELEAMAPRGFAEKVNGDFHTPENCNTTTLDSVRTTTTSGGSPPVNRMEPSASSCRSTGAGRFEPRKAISCS